MEDTEIIHYAIDDGLYMVERTPDDIRAYVLQSNGMLREVSPGRVEYHGTPIDMDEFVAEMRSRMAAAVQRPKPARLFLVVNNPKRT